ncbi:MAG: hypothetical protein ABMB14_03985 [Myxococcota bacterium]
MISLLLSLPSPAFAQDATPITAITWARPVTLAAPIQWSMRGDHPAVTEGVLVELRADPALLVPRQSAEPVLYAGAMPVMRFNWDYLGGCVVAFVPGPVDLAATELYFGSSALPERVTAADGGAARAAARVRGIRPAPSAERAAALAAGGPALAASDLGQVHAEAMARVGACTATPSDTQRPGVPAQRP